MRYPPIPREDWTEEQAAVAKAIVDGPRGEVRGPFVPLLHAPKLAGNVQALGEAIRFHTSFANDQLEIAVLVTACQHDCPNIWESHSKLAMKAGVSRDIIAAIAERRRPEGMSPEQSLVHSFALELHENKKVRERLFDEVVSRWGKKGAMELAGICGYYGMLAAILNAAERPLVDPAAVPFGLPSV